MFNCLFSGSTSLIGWLPSFYLVSAVLIALYFILFCSSLLFNLLPPLTPSLVPFLLPLISLLQLLSLFHLVHLLFLFLFESCFSLSPSPHLILSPPLFLIYSISFSLFSYCHLYLSAFLSCFWLQYGWVCVF